MPTCRSCNIDFLNQALIRGKVRNLQRRKFCLDCSPFGAHNTRKALGFAPRSSVAQVDPRRFSTKQSGDVAEARVLFELLDRGFNVLVPHGDRLPYDLAVDISGRLVTLQVKRAWQIIGKAVKNESWAVDPRRHRTNRKHHKTSMPEPRSYHFLLVWRPDNDSTYILPEDFVRSYKSSIILSPRSRAQEHLGRWEYLV